MLPRERRRTRGADAIVSQGVEFRCPPAARAADYSATLRMRKATVRVVWRGGAITEFVVTLPVNAVTALPRYREMVGRICSLTHEGPIR